MFDELFDVNPMLIMTEPVIRTRNDVDGFVRRIKEMEQRRNDYEHGKFRVKIPERVEPKSHPRLPESIFERLERCDNDLSRVFETDENGNDGGYEEQEKMPAKNPFVFIANRLTFLIKTRHPIIWDTSTIRTIGESAIFVAFDKDKNPMLNLSSAAKIAHAVNCDNEIQNEIGEYLDGTEWSRIYCMPQTMLVDDKPRFGFMFAVESRT